MVIKSVSKAEGTEIYVFARFHVRTSAEADAMAALRETVAESGKEPGCVRIQAFQSTRDARLFYIHSRWTDESAFDLHATLPHTVRFLTRMDGLIDQPREVTRTQPLDSRRDERG